MVTFSLNISHIAITAVTGVGYHCIIHCIGQHKVIHLLQNYVLEDCGYI